MNKQCTLIPYRKTKDGELKESKLYKDLLSLTSRNRVVTNKLYSTILSESFRDKYKDSIETDDIDEPILGPLLKKAEISNLLESTKVKDSILRTLGGSTKEGLVHFDNTAKSYSELSAKVTEFNKTSQYNGSYVTLIKKDDEGLYLSVEDRTDENEVIADKIATNLALNEKIKQILEASGIKLNVLEKYQDRLMFTGSVNYSTATETAEGIINLISIANDMGGEQALPEEFAHLAFDLLGDDSLAQRLLSVLDNEAVLQRVLGEEFDAYSEVYTSKEDLKREAAGKLIYQSWFQHNNPIPEYRTFIGKFINQLKKFINFVFKRDDVVRAVNEAYDAASILGQRIIESTSLETEKLKELNDFSTLYRLENGAKSKGEILQKSLDNMMKNFTFYSEALVKKINRETDIERRQKLQDQLDDYRFKAQKYILEQRSNIDGKTFDAGLQSFVEYSAEEIVSVTTRLNKLANSTASLQEKAYQIANIRNIIASIKGPLSDIIESLEYEDTDIQLPQETINSLKTLFRELSSREVKVLNESRKVFGDFLSKFMPESGMSYTKDGKTVTFTKDDINELLLTAEKDIGFFDTFVQAASNSEDMVIKLADRAIKESKEAKRRRVLEIQKKLFAASKALKDSGFSDEFMFEKKKDGSLSVRYISEVNWTKFFEDKNEFYAHLKEKYGHNPSGADLNAYRAEESAWYSDHTDVFGNPGDFYRNKDFLSALPKAQAEYYLTFMEIREELVKCLPPAVYQNDPMKAVQITKDFLDRIKDSGNISEVMSQLKDAAYDSLFIKIDDDEFGSRSVNRGFDDEEIFSIPIFFTNRLKDDKFLSRDTASTLYAFADMAINYDEMSKVIDILELGKPVLTEREAGQLKGGKPVQEKISAFGIEATRNITKKGNNFVVRYNALLETQLYGRYLKDEGTDVSEHDRLSFNKAARLLNRFSSLNQLALNTLASIAAVGSDMIQANSEVLAGSIANGKGHFNAKQLWEADKIYRKDIVKVLGELGNPIKTSKLALFIEKFDVLHEYENEVRNAELKKGKARKLLSENSLYFMLQAGAHWGETRTAIAQALAAEITSDDGTKTANLWDILDVEYLDPNDHSKGARLVTKEGFTLTPEQETYYTRKFNSLNQRLYGIYSKSDINTFQTTAVGQLVFLYRKYLIPSLNRRFGKATYNLDLDAETEGYYRSAIRFLYNLIRDSKDLGRSMSAYWSQMTDNERSNCMRAINEFGTFLILSGLVALLKNADWDKKDNPWHRRFIAYIASRLKTETGAFTPIGMGKETWNIIKSPAAGVNTLEGMANITKALVPSNWWGEDSEVKQGRYKGKKKGYKAIMDSPFVPMNKTIYRALHPEESIIAFE